MRAYGNAGALVTATEGPDLTVVTRGLDPFEAREKARRWTSPIPPPSPETTAAEKAAQQAEAAAVARRLQQMRTKVPRPPKPRTTKPASVTYLHTQPARPPKPLRDRSAEADAKRAAKDAARAVEKAAKDAARAEFLAQRAAKFEAEREAFWSKERRDREARVSARQAAIDARSRAKAADADAVRDGVAEGKSLVQIAGQIGRSVSHVQKTRRAAGIPKLRATLDRPTVLATYARLRSSQLVADELGCNRNAVLYHLREAGADMRRPGDNGLSKDDEVRTAALADYAAGERVRAILDRYGIGETTLLRWRTAAGMTGRPAGRYKR